MKREKLLLLSCLLALLAGGLHAVAQEKDGLQADTFKVLRSQYAPGKVVKGAPYSATAITETIQTLSDGNQIIRKNEARIYRDTEGRARLEQRLETIGQWAAAGEPRRLIHINDPVTGFYYDLDPRARTAVRGGGGKDRLAALAQDLELTRTYEAFRDEKNPTAKASKGVELMQEMEKRKQERLKKEAQKADAGKNDSPLSDGGPPSNPKKKGSRRMESLGKQTLEGVEVEGTRSTLTIPAGAIGNTLPIEIVDESWYSPELQIMMLTRRSDPRSGVTTYRLTNLNRGEPDRALFEVPADYTLRYESTLPLKKRRPPEEEQ
ncbi:MAG: hypothetical protein ACREAM_17510 [Blastocatellia bacterium]